jgi:hypothetical protein
MSQEILNKVINLKMHQATRWLSWSLHVWLDMVLRGSNPTRSKFSKAQAVGKMTAPMVEFGKLLKNKKITQNHCANSEVEAVRKNWNL